MPAFADRLAAAVTAARTPLVVGIDPRWEQLPDRLRTEDSPVGRADAYRRFSLGVIEAVAGVAAAVKPQAAFFEELGPPGAQALAEVIAAARASGLPVILDAKRNDIGSTATAYARGMLGHESAWGADALTVSPYLGDDSLTPFVETAIERDAGIFVLVKTSNPGGALWQDALIDSRPLYRHVGEHVESLAAQSAAECGYGAVGAVAGATYPEQLAELREAMPHTWFLVPGFGAQGGSADDVAGAFDERGLGAIVNSSRGVIFAHNRPEYESLAGNGWQAAVHQAARDASDQLAAAAGLRT
ncbi:MAG: orotidine-5'-phosphate decarboxylase [Planctomycetota bacterium]